MRLTEHEGRLTFSGPRRVVRRGGCLADPSGSSANPIKRKTPLGCFSQRVPIALTRDSLEACRFAEIF